MRLSKIALGLGFALAAATVANTASAAKWTLDYRHEIRSEYKENFDRIAIIAGFDNGIGFYVDSSFKSGTNRPDKDPNKTTYDEGQWGNFVTNATEMSLWWGYKIPNTGFTITPGIVTESTSTVTAYKPYLRFQYNTDFGLWFAVRPRFDYAHNDGAGPNDYDTTTYRIDAWVGYSSGNFGINYNYTHMWVADDTNRSIYNNKDYNYEHNIAMNYRFGQWNPYIEFGEQSVWKDTDDRQFRLRTGIQYTF